VRLRLIGDVAVEFHHPSSAESCAFTIPMNALTDCAGRGNSTVAFQPLKDGKVHASWEQSGIPNRREYSAAARVQEFPAWPGRDLANNTSLPLALDAAMQIPIGGPGRLSLNHIQLRGRQGDIAATDGRQLLIQGGFKFPWKEAVSLPRTQVFAAPELRNDDVVRVAQSKTHAFFRVGPWTVALAIATAVRFPDVDAVVPKASATSTRWLVNSNQAAALIAMLDRLPGAQDEHAPITL